MPTDEETWSSINKLKSRKSPGTCDIPAEVLKAIDTSGFKKLKAMLHKIWIERKVPQDFKDGIIIPVYKKGDRAMCENYRGITLLSIAGKILTSIINNRLSSLYESILREQQCGFRKGRGCADQIYTLRQALERRLRNGQPTIVTFIDFAAALDSLHRYSIWKVLRIYGIPDLYIDIRKDMYAGAESFVRTSKGRSKVFSLSTGVRQGCILSAMLFNIILNWILLHAINQNDGVIVGENVVITDLDYADDIATLSESENTAQALIDSISDKAAQFGMKIKSTKTKAMYCHTQEVPQLSVNSETIEVVDHFCYLGGYVMSQGMTLSGVGGTMPKTVEHVRHNISPSK